MTDFQKIMEGKPSIIQRAYELRHAAVARSGRLSLDKKTSCWLIRYDQKRLLMMEAKEGFLSIGVFTSKIELFGLPIRWTVDDDPATPEIQMVMEPDLLARRSS